MSWLDAFHRSRLERDMQEEMAAHIEQARERYASSGMSNEEALQAARIEFGHLGTMQQEGRDARGGQLLSSMLGDVRYALRHYARTPLTTVTIVLTLALGIGFSSAVFSVLDGMLRRPAPGVPNEPELVKIRGLTDRTPFTRTISYPELLAYGGLTDVFADVAGWVNASAVLETGADEPVERIPIQIVTPNFFPLLGVGMAHGRGFWAATKAAHAAAAPADEAIISDVLAGQYFGDAREAIGREIRLNGVRVTIVGATGERFHGAVPSGQYRMIWLPLSAWHTIQQVDRAALNDPTATHFEAIARLRPGLAASAASPAARVVAARFDADSRAMASRPWTGSADVVRLRGVELNMSAAEELPEGATLAIIIALLILLVCTTTVSSLLVGAATMRRHEIGVRLSLGASRGRVVRQLLTEVAILAVTGGLVGTWTLGVLMQVTEVSGDGFDIRPNLLTTAFVMLFALLTAALAGLSPALHATRTGVAGVLKESGGGASRKSRLQRLFVVAQIAVAQPLMVVLGMAMMKAFSDIAQAGGDPVQERLVALELDTRIGIVRREPDPVPALVRRIAALPGVEAVVPLAASVQGPVRVSLAEGDRAATTVFAVLHQVGPGYFAAIDAPLLAGRDFIAADTLREVTPVVIDRGLADSLVPAGSAVGRRIEQQVPGSDERIVFEVIGVAAVTRSNEPQRYNDEWHSLYLPLRRRPGDARLLIRTSGPGEAIMPAMLEAARAEAPLAPVTRIRTTAQYARDERLQELKIAGALAGMGALALLMASVGLYAMVRLAVAQRRREIGIRIALGADAGRVVRMFFRSGVLTSALGLAVGLPVTVAALVLMANQFGAAVSNVVMAGAMVTAAVLIVAALASWLPARRAARVDAMVTLRA